MSSPELPACGPNKLLSSGISEGIAAGSLLSPQAKETLLNNEIESSAMTRPIPPAVCPCPADLSDMIREFAETGMKDPATRVLLERAREWQAAESSASSKDDHTSAPPDHDAEDHDDVSTPGTVFMSHPFSA
jgi:hypothetical protein